MATPLNLRYPAPSPDGSKICFSYLGDLWVVSAKGGQADRLTVSPSYDAFPKWSPDGIYIAYSSQRNGNYDVYIIPSTGGSESRVTYHSADDIVTGWSADSRRVLFTSQRDHQYRQVWEAPAAGGRARPLTNIESFSGQRSPDANKLLFVRGAVPWWRAGYRGTAACDLMVKDLTSGSIERVTSSACNEMDGYWVPGGGAVVFVSDSGGVYNLYQKNLVSGVVTQLTDHRTSASHLSVSQDASLAAYELAGEIYLYDFKTGQGRKLEADVPAFPPAGVVEKKVYDSGISEFALSPDGNLLAYVVGGQVFCRDLAGAYQQQLTSTIDDDQGLSWSPDSKQLALVSDRDLSYDVYLLRSTDQSQPSLARSHDREIAPFAKSDASKRTPQISPDQTKLAYVRAETDLVVTDIKRFTERVLSDKDPVGSFGWSPDGRYVVFTRFDEDWDNQLFIGDSESGTVYRINKASGSYLNPRFSPDGRLIYFVNDNDIYYLYLERRLAEMTFTQRREYATKNKPKNALGLPTVMIDFDGIAERATRLTDQGNIEMAVMSANSSSVVYITSAGHIERINLDGSEHKLISWALDTPSQPQLTPTGDALYVRDRNGKLYELDPNGGAPMPVPFSAEVQIDHRQEMLHVFDQAWELLKERYFDATFNGLNWNSVRETFLPRVQAATEVNDVYDIIREMAGELNCSHINIWHGDLLDDETGLLGIVPDYDDNSAGLKIKYVIAGSPAAKSLSRLRLDDKITAVEGRKLVTNVDYYTVFENTVGKEIKLDIFSRDGISRSVLITPFSSEEYYNAEFADRAGKARETVDKLSGKKFAYVQLRHMDHDGMDGFTGELDAELTGKKGLILDIRGNVGGANHDRLLEYLSRRNYITHKPRYGTPGQDSPGAVDIPIVLLIDEYTTSDAEIFAQGFRELGLGTVLGTTTYGAVLGTEHHKLLDGSTLTLPAVGWYTLKGASLENSGVAPDVEIPSNLTRLEKGDDNQLEEAVKFLQQKIK